jgi:hypothetical protein
MTDGVSGGVWTLQAATLDATYVGATMTIAGSVSNNGAWVIASVLTPHTFTTTATPVTEAFANTVTATFQPANTIATLTDTLQPGALWLELFMAISVIDKAEQESSPLQVRLAAQTKRIVDAMRYKQDEPKQVPLASGRHRGRHHGGGWI